MNLEAKTFYERAGLKYAEFQERRYLKFSNLFDEVSWLQFSAWLPAERGARILDAGCGGGGWSLRLATLGYRNLTLVDFSSTCIEGARAIFRRHGLERCGRFLVADLADLRELADGEFDFVLCERDPLEYCVDDQDRAFAELVRVLRDGAVLTLSAGTAYRRRQALLRDRRFPEFLEFVRTGVCASEEGPLRPLDRARILDLFAREGVEKLCIAGRLTLCDLLDETGHDLVYADAELKAKLLQLEMEHQAQEDLADGSSHIFAAGRKRRRSS